MQGHGARKFTTSALIASSSERDWPLIAVDVRSHPAGAIDPFVTESTELTLVLSDAGAATVLRSANGVRQSAAARPGTTFVIPVGTTEEATYLTSDIARVMHLYLSDALFETIATEDHIPTFDRRNVRYVSGLRDPSLAWLASTVLAELRQPTSVGGPLVETLSLSLAERLVLNYTDGVSLCAGGAPPSGLDSARLRRVLDYIHQHLSEPVSVRDMAAVACLSPFHFARAFRTSVGQAPHRYLSDQRLALAQRLLRCGDTSIAEIGYLCQFASPANFTRAFRSATGMTPRAYRHERV